MAMAIKKMWKPMIIFSDVPEDTASKVEIFIWENKYKEANNKDTTFKVKNKKMYILLLQHYTT